MISRTDARKAARYLTDASRYYEAHAVSSREQDRARLMRLLAKKINNKLNSTKPEKEKTKTEE